ncbi:MAG: ATP-dependent zinc protease [Ardenticatenales bacterium]|nr:ATP-dependent zinc protease [Ardenticatenales bacterium]
MAKRARRPLETIGWREWVTLPELGIAAVKVKVDTGARSSALHAWNVARFKRDGAHWVRFQVHPIIDDDTTTVTCEAPLLGMKWVRSSSGKKTFRPVIHTTFLIGSHRYSIDLTLVRRDLMGFRMLLGRQALRRRFLVNSGRSFVQSARDPALAGTGDVDGDHDRAESVTVSTPAPDRTPAPASESRP